VTLQFFILAALYAVFTRSRWRYVLAAVATMVRYDAAALIVVAFVLDMMSNKDARRRLTSALGAALACVPLGIWLLGTVLHFKGEGSTHYLNELGTDGALAGVLVQYTRMVWSVAVSPLFVAPASLPKAFGAFLSYGVSAVLLAGFCLGAVRSIARRQWEVMGLLIFLALYLLVHSLHSFVLQRFCSTVYWIILLVAFWGLQGLWSFGRERLRLSDGVTTALQAVASVVLLLWLLDVARLLPPLAGNSLRSASLPGAGIVLAGLFVAGQRICLAKRPPVRHLLVLVAFCGIIVSNQCTLVLAVGDGQTDVEFRQLADWCRDNTRPGEKLASTYCDVLGLYLPERKADFVHTSALKAETLEGFTENCRQAGIAYVAWDSRLGASRHNRYYAFYGLDALTELGEPVSTGPYAFVTQIKTDLGRYINVFYLGARLDDDGLDVRLVESFVDGFQAESGRPLLP